MAAQPPCHLCFRVVSWAEVHEKKLLSSRDSLSRVETSRDCIEWSGFIHAALGGQTVAIFSCFPWSGSSKNGGVLVDARYRFVGDSLVVWDDMVGGRRGLRRVWCAEESMVRSTNSHCDLLRQPGLFRKPSASVVRSVHSVGVIFCWCDSPPGLPFGCVRVRSLFCGYMKCVNTLKFRGGGRSASISILDYGVRCAHVPFAPEFTSLLTY